jgi:HTH-type transcriptional regulator/antitoxin HigA
VDTIVADVLLAIKMTLPDAYDAMAQEALIPEKSWSTAKVRETLSSKDAVAFADEIGVHPAIVAGRLRHEEKNFRLLSHLIRKTGQVSQTFTQ